MTTTLPTWAIVVATLITALGGVSAIRSLFLVGGDKRKIVADAHQSEAAVVKMFGEAATTLVLPLTERVKDLEAREREAKAEVTRLTAEVHRLTTAEDTEMVRLRNENQRLVLELAQARATRGGSQVGESS
jgi:hypothetical protein